MGIGRVPAPTGPDRFDWDTLRAGLRLAALRRTRNEDAAEEAAQEVLARTVVLVQDRGITDPDEVARIAHGIARHVLVDEARKQTRFTNFLSRQKASDRDRGIDALAKLITQEERLRLRRAWDTLSPRDRQILRRTFFDEMAPGALARELREPAERMRKRKSRALAHLRESFLADDTSPARGTAPAHAPTGHGPGDRPIYDVSASPVREVG